jgi:branched-chain amino acid transport system permease protein
MKTTFLPWGLFAASMALAPWVFDSTLGLNLLSQMGIAIIACLSFNLLFGYGGMLSFGHAVYTGVGAYTAIHALKWMSFSGWGWPVSAVPLLAGAGSAMVALVLGGITTRRGGMPLAMITLGLGEMLYAAAHRFAPVFGGEGGISANRVLGSPVWGISLGPQIELYALIAAYTLVSAALIAALTRSPLGRVLTAVRDNPERAGFLGLDQARVRYRVFVWAAFFAGIAGGLAALNFENVTPEVFSSHRSGSYVLFTFLGGAGFFHGPIVGAVLMVLTQVLLSHYTPAWLLYLGLLFVVMVVLAPAGLASLPARYRHWRNTRIEGTDAARARGRVGVGAGGCLILAGGMTLAEMGYHLQLGSALGPDMLIWGLPLSTSHPWHWWGAAATLFAGLALVAISRLGSGQANASFAPSDDSHGALDSAEGAALTSTSPVPSHPVLPQPQAVLAPHSPPSLQVHQLGKRLGETHILQNVSLTVRPGECLAIIGPNGAGKSTLFNLVSGRFRASGGMVTLGTQRIDKLSPRQIHAMGLGRSFQISHLFATLTVLENLRCAVLAHSGRGLSLHLPAEEHAGIDARTRQLMASLGLQHRQQVQAQHLSYAEQRALELGLALAADPQVLLLDEPTAGMSKAETRRTLALIRRLTCGKTLLIVEHDMSVVFDLADRIAVLEQGKLIACDTPEAVRANPRVQQAYLGQANSRSHEGEGT